VNVENISVFAGNTQKTWFLNGSQLKLIASDGEIIPLSYKEYCLLNVAGQAKGSLVSRKTLIEALGHSYLHYDERCLESLISRLRRKLASFLEEAFSIRSVKGKGYVFNMEMLEILD
jgi:DNA-binding response OmpR family regulator